MCLVTTQKKQYYTKKDMVVYKEVRFYDDNVVKSPYEYFFYEIGKLYETKFSFLNYGYCYDVIAEYDFDEIRINRIPFKIIAEGFHSFSNIDRIPLHLKMPPALDYPVRLYECVIPKGSQYFKDRTGLIVSNKIIIKKQCV